jgi:hypothetical protein
MQCYFLRDGHIAGVEMLPLGLSDEDSVARTRTLSSKRKGPFDGFEVWDHGRFVFRTPPSRQAACAASPWARQSPLTDDRTRGGVLGPKWPWPAQHCVTELAGAGERLACHRS